MINNSTKSTKRTITSHHNSLATKTTRYMMLQIRVLTWERHNNVAEFTTGMGNKHKNFNVMFLIYRLRLTTFQSFGYHILQRSVVDTVKVTHYNIASQIVYERNQRSCNMCNITYEIIGTGLSLKQGKILDLTYC